MTRKSLALALSLAAAPVFGSAFGSALAATPSYHVMRLGPVAPPSQTASTMLYYAGPVIAKMKAVGVIWGSHVNKITAAQIGGFLGAIVNSTYVDQLAQYDTNIKGVNGKPGTDQSIVRGTYLGKFQITPKNTSKKLTDADVQAELQGQIAAGKLPAADLNTLYLIYFPRNVTITIAGLTSCVQFGAYHSSMSPTISPSNIFYTVEPDCGGGFGYQTVASSHEYAEATTDAIPTPGSNPAYPQAWNTSNGQEIGDLCEGNNTTLKTASRTYSVQEVFDNAHGRCATGTFTSP